MTVLADSSAVADPARRATRLRSLIAWIALVAATLAAYAPALGAGFIWDDDGHVTRPDLRSLHGLWRIWFELGATQQYYPVLHTAFWFEHRLWGDAPLGYHLLNILLHAAAACLLVAVLRRLRVPGAWAAGLLFALHPLGVESVAWISEEKNTLSGVFYLLAALAYLRFDGRREWGAYVLGLVAFALALGSKTVTATLPAALLVVLWWRRGALSWRRDVVPLLPWLGLGAAAGGFTAWVERTYIGARGVHFALTLGERVLLAGRIVCFYAGKLFWPAHLMFIYPRWTVDSRAAGQYIFPFVVAAAIAAAWAIRRRSRAPLAAILLFVGTLFPALGFVNVYPFVFSYVADHFQYLAEFSAMAAIAAAGAVWIRRPAVRVGALAVLAVALGLLTWREAGVYRDVEAFYRTLLARNPACWLADDNLGVILAGRGRFAEATRLYERARELNPDFPQTYNNLGNAMARQRRWNEAFADYARALQLWPGFVQAENDWGDALADAGQYSRAAEHFESSLRIQAADPAAEYGLANALANDGRLPSAIDHYRAALQLDPKNAEAHANLGLALAMTGDLSSARAEVEAALRLRPRYPEAHAYLGLVLARSGDLGGAVREYRAALAIDPGNGDVHYQLALALRQLGDAAGAAAEFDAANRLQAGGEGR